MIVRDADGTIRYWSREAERIYGWAPQEVLGTRTHHLFETTFPQPLQDIEREMQEKNAWRGQLIQKRRDGSRITVNSRWNAQHNPDTHSFTVIEFNEKVA